MLRHVFSLVLMFVLFFGAVFLALNTPWILQSIAPPLLEKVFPEVEIDSLKVARQSIHLPEDLVLTDVDVQLIHQSVPGRVRIKSITFHNILTFWRNKDQLKLDMEGLTINRESLEMENAKAKVFLTFPGMNVLPRIEGVYAAEQCTFQNFHLQNFFGRIKGQRDGYQLYDLSMQGYGGKLTGQITLEYLPAFNFVIWLEFNDVTPRLLAGFFDDFFLQLDGKASGSLRILGDRERFELFDLNLRLPQGRLGPDLAQSLWAKTSGQDKAQLAGILPLNSALDIYDATTRFQSTNEYRVNVSYTFKTALAAYPLAGNLDIDVPEGIRQVLSP